MVRSYVEIIIMGKRIECEKVPTNSVNTQMEPKIPPIGLVKL